MKTLRRLIFIIAITIFTYKISDPLKASKFKSETGLLMLQPVDLNVAREIQTYQHAQKTPFEPKGILLIWLSKLFPLAPRGKCIAGKLFI